MGTISITSGDTGRTYDITIAGDQITPEEAARANAGIQQRDAAYREQYAAQTGQAFPEANDGTAFFRGVDRGKTTSYSALGSLVEGIGTVNDWEGLAGIGARMTGAARAEQVRENTYMPAPMSFADANTFGEYATAIGEAAGQSAPEMLATMAGGVAGGMAGGPAGFIAGGAAVGVPLFTGRNIERRADVVGGLDNLTGEDLVRAFGAAIPQAALNSIGDKLLIGPLARTGTSFGSRAVIGALQGGATELPTEVSQQILERAQAGLPLDDDEAIAEYWEAGLGALAVGGVFGGVSGPLRGRPANTDRTDRTDQTDPQDGAAPAAGTTPRATDAKVRDLANSIPNNDAPTDNRAPADILLDLGVPAKLPVHKRVSKMTAGDPAVWAELRKWIDTGDHAQRYPDAKAKIDAQPVPAAVKTTNPATATPISDAVKAARELADKLGIVSKPLRAFMERTDPNDPKLLSRMATYSTRANVLAKRPKSAAATAAYVKAKQVEAATNAVEDTTAAEAATNAVEETPDATPNPEAVGDGAPVDQQDTAGDLVPGATTGATFASTRNPNRLATPGGDVGSPGVAEGTFNSALAEKNVAKKAAEQVAAAQVAEQVAAAQVAEQVAAAQVAEQVAAEATAAVTGATPEPAAVPDIPPSVSKGIERVQEKNRFGMYSAFVDGHLVSVALNEDGSVNRSSYQRGNGAASRMINNNDPTTPMSKRAQRLADYVNASNASNATPATPAQVDAGATLTAEEAALVQRWYRDTQSSRLLVDLAPSTAELKALEALDQAGAVYDSAFAVRDDQPGLPHRRVPSAGWTGYHLSEVMKSANPEEVFFAGKVRAAQVAVYRTSARRVQTENDVVADLIELLPARESEIRADPYTFIEAALADTQMSRIEPKFTPQQSATPESSTANAEQVAKTPEAQAAAERRAAAKQRAIDDRAAVQAAEQADIDQRALPRADPNAAPDADTRNALGGRTTEAAGQTVPPGVPPARVPTKAPVTPTEVASQADLLRRGREHREARKAARDRFTAKATPLEQSEERKYAGEYGDIPDVMTTADYNAIETLMAKPEEGKVALTASEKSARLFFKKDSDPMKTLVNIGAGFEAETELRKKGTKDESTVPAYFQGVTRQAARSAAKWVRENLSPDASKYVADMVAEQSYDAVNAANDVYQTSVAANTRAAKEADLRAKLLVEDIDNDTFDTAMTAIDAEAKAEAATEAARAKLRRDLADKTITQKEFDSAMTEHDGLAMGPVTSAQLALKRRAHPTVVNALRAGDIRAAMTAINLTAADTKLAKMAAAFTGHLAGVSVAVVPSTNTALGADGSANPLWITRNNGATEEAAGIYYTDGRIYLADTATGLDVATIMHEAFHAVTAQELRDPSSPFTKSVEALRGAVKKRIADEVGAVDAATNEVYEYALLTNDEFVTNGLTNDAFKGALDQIVVREGTGGTTLWTKFMAAARNLIAKLMREPYRKVPREERTAYDALDVLTTSLLTTPGALVPANPMYSAAMNPVTAMAALDMSKRLKDYPAGMAERFFKNHDWVGAGTVTGQFIADTVIPMANMAEYGAKYFGPMAREAYNLVTGHNAAIKRINEKNLATIDVVAAFVRKFPALGPEMNNMAFTASKWGIDPRNPMEYYTEHTLQYFDLDADGVPTKRHILVFTGEDATVRRTKKLQELNADTKPDTRSGATFKNTPERGDFKEHYWRKLNAQLVQMDQTSSGAASDAYGRALGMFQNLHRENARVMKAQIEASLPGNRALQQTIYADVFKRMFMEGHEAYLPLTREGKYWLTYTAWDFDTKSIEVVKEVFHTEPQRRDAVAELGKLGPEYQVGNIAEFSNFQEYHASQPPTLFASKTITAIDKNVEARAVAAGEKAYDAAIAASADAVKQGTLTEAQSYTDADAAKERAEFEHRKGAEADAKVLKETITNMMLDMIPEHSIMNNYRVRAGTSGMKGVKTLSGAQEMSGQDLIHLLRKKSSTMSRQLADREFNAWSADLKSRMTAHATETSPKLSAVENAKMGIVLNTLTKALGNINVHRHPAVKALNSIAYVMTLGFNASSAVFNVMGLPTIVQGHLGGEYGNMKAARAMTNAGKVLAGSAGRSRILTRIDAHGNEEAFTHDTSRWTATLENYLFKPYDATRGYDSGDNKLARYGVLTEFMRNAGLFADSIHFDNLDVQGMATGGMHQKIMMASAIMMHKTETSVREITAMAAYDLELGKLAKDGIVTEADMQAAAMKAVLTTEATNGTIAAAAQPNKAQHGIMPALYMFKRYPLTIYNLLGSLLNRSLPGHKKLLEQFTDVNSDGYKDGMASRRVARLQLAHIGGYVGLFAGVSGMPMYGAITAMLDMMFKDDDELDADTLFRLAIGEGASRGLVNYLFGVEASSRIGLANMFYRRPFNADNNPPLWNLLEGVGGPVVGITNSLATRPWELFAQGQNVRAIESLMPTAARNLMKTYRYASEGGATSTRGDMIAEIGAGQVLGQFLGFSPAEYIRQTQLNGALKTMDVAIAAQRTAALRRLNLAERSNNAAALLSAREIIADFNARNPDYSIEPETEARSASSFRDTTARIYHGVTFNSHTEKRMRDWLSYFEGTGPKPD